MKKIININLSGRVIPIEDTAYEKLQAYIESLRRYFANEEGRDEIINDIESRIAELMSEKVRKGAVSVTDGDVDEIIASMGRPEDFDAEAAEEKSAPGSSQTGSDQYYSSSQARTKRRLYRDSNDKFIGGVCGGIANYLNIDPAIVRILFAIIAFGGFGLGFFLYILLWIILPDKDLEGFSGKRLYRNPDDRVIGGVAGGLAAYFDKRTSTIRFIFIAPIILSILISMINGFGWRHGFDFFPNIVFGSLSSTFVLAYVVLWMILPEARSSYEKMEMRGEKVDVNSIRQNVREGMENVKDRVKGWSEEVKTTAQNLGSKAKEFAGTRGKSFANDVRDTARTGGRGLGHAIGVLFKVFFLFVAGTIAFGLFVALIALIFGGVAWWPVNDFLWTSKWQLAFAWGTLLFFFLVPLIGLIIWIIRRILRVRSRNSYLGWTFGFLWTLGWVCAILLTASISNDFREKRYVDIVIPVVQPIQGKMIVTASQPILEYNGGFIWVNSRSEGWDLSSDTLRLSTIRFPEPQKSPDSLYHVIIRKYSYGKNAKEAENRAEKIQYDAVSKDSILDLASGYAIDKDSKFRMQQVEIEIQVPVGKKIRFDESVTEKLNPANFRFRRVYHRRKIVDIEVDEDYSFGFRAGVDYIMGIDGKLKDPSGNPVNTDDYRYENNSNKTPATEEQKTKEEEDSKKQKQIQNEKNQNKQKQTSVKLNLISNEKSVAITKSPSPVFSLVSWLD